MDKSSWAWKETGRGACATRGGWPVSIRGSALERQEAKKDNRRQRCSKRRGKQWQQWAIDLDQEEERLIQEGNKSFVLFGQDV